MNARSLLALYAATVAVYSDLYVTQPFLPILSRRFGVSPATAGLSISVVVLMIAFVSPVWGSLSDSAGRKPVIVASVALLSIPTILGAFAPGFGVLLVLRALQGLLIPGLTAVAVAFLGDHFHGAALPPKVAAWIGAFLIGAAVLFAFIAVFTYLPYYLTSPPFGLSTAAVSSFYFAFVAGVVTSLLVPRLPERWSGRRLMAAGLSIACAVSRGRSSFPSRSSARTAGSAPDRPRW